MQKCNAKNLWKCNFRASSRRVIFSYFIKVALDHGGMSPDTFWNFCGPCYNIQFKPYAISKIVDLLQRALF